MIEFDNEFNLKKHCFVVLGNSSKEDIFISKSISDFRSYLHFKICDDCFLDMKDPNNVDFLELQHSGCGEQLCIFIVESEIVFETIQGDIEDEEIYIDEKINNILMNALKQKKIMYSVSNFS